ncbi:ankyrin repeat-containing domain protein [Flagelloscypha sp. PMI_526]|nr:ankyrin repeat-containing domain protein [Flagelloscypha sp. PMI_526]
MFDIICGTGIGGLYAVLFASLNLTIGQAIQVHQLLNDMLFNSAAWLEKDQKACLAAALKTLDRMVEQLEVKIPLNQQFNQHVFTKAFILVVNSSSAGCHRVLRNFPCRRGSSSCTIKEALLVCLSDSVHIGPVRIQGEEFLNGVNGFANPTRILIQEFVNAFPNSSEAAACLVNIGAGHPGILPITNAENGEETAALLRSCEHIAEDVGVQCHELGSFFFRFSVSSSARQSHSDDSEFISLIKGLTAEYMNAAEVTSRIDSLVKILKERHGVLPLERLCSFAGKDGQSQLSTKVASVQRDLDSTILHNVNFWLRPIHQTSKLDSNIRARGETTCRWLLVNAVFVRWMEAKGGLFWFHGLMGTGKTVMSSFIIQTLLARKDIYVAYYYFEFTNPVTLSEEALFRSLVAQLAGISSAVTRSLHQKHNDGSLQPQLETLQAALNELLSLSSKPVFIIIDALDELPVDQRKYLLQSLLTFCTSGGASQTHIMITSREEVDILRAFEGKIDFELGVQGDLVRQDIAAFVDRQLQAEKWKLWPQNEVEIMRRRLNERANGQFRMVACQIDILQRVKNSRQLEESLLSLPHSLGETYNRILERIPGELRKLAHRLFAILSFASGRISITEISAMLAVEFSSDDDSNDVPKFQAANLFHDPLDVVDLGTSLVSRVASSSGTWLQLAHASVKEYLLASSSCWFSLNEDLAHHVIASAALALLLHFQVLQQDSAGPNFYEYSLHKWHTHVLPNGPLRLLLQQRLLYASCPWKHRTYCIPSSKLDSTVFLGLFDICREFLTTDTWSVDALTNALAWGARSYQQQHNIQCCLLLLSHGARENMSIYKSAALRTAASLNNSVFVQFLVEAGADVNENGGKAGTALYTAAYAKSSKVLRYLIQVGANMNMIGGKHGTALHAAAYVGAKEVIQCLIENGADVNALGGKYGTVLQTAASRSPAEVVRYLVEEGADVNKNGGEYGTALHIAISRDATEIVQLLIEEGANVNAIGEDYAPALQVAAQRWSLEMVQYLVGKGADVNSIGRGYGTALQAAADRRSFEIVQYLVDLGADVNVVGGSCGTALQAAAYQGAFDIVQYLVEKGADVNSIGGGYGSALKAAVHGRSLKIVQYLVDKEADTNLIGGEYATALQAAAYKKSFSIVQCLVEKGADLNLIGGNFGTALQAAAHNGSFDIVQYLIKKGADVNLIGGKHGTALQAAVLGSPEVAQYLVEKGADVNLIGGVYGTALQAAVLGSPEVAQYLVEKGADVNLIGGVYGTALQAAASSFSLGMVQYLVGKGADVNLIGGEYGTALQAAASSWLLEMVQYLVGEGADVNLIGGKYGTALQAAALSLSMVQYLVGNGADVNLFGGEYGSALRAAVCEELFRLNDYLVELGAIENESEGKCEKALQAAVQGKSLETFQDLIGKGAVVNLIGGECRTRLQAGGYGSFEVARYLTEKGADVNTIGGKYRSRLGIGRSFDLLKVTQCHIDEGADGDVLRALYVVSPNVDYKLSDGSFVLYVCNHSI